MNNITIELSEQDRDLLKALLFQLVQIENRMTAEQPAPEEPKQEPAAVTIEQVRDKVVELSAAGKKPEATAIVKKYARKVSEIPLEDIGKVWAELEALNG